jgi:hypothetical protein
MPVSDVKVTAMGFQEKAQLSTGILADVFAPGL